MSRFALAGVSMAALLAASVPALAEEAAGLDPSLKLNQLQVLGTHNSYSMPADKRLIAVVEPIIGRLQGAMGKKPAAEAALFREEHPNHVTITEALAYTHPDLKTQLDIGVRSLELDVNPDPEGGRFADPAGYRLLRGQGASDLAPFDAAALKTPGYKVFHMPDIDFRSHCATLKLCLTQVREWSDAHPRHVPLFIVLEAKVSDVPILPDPTHTTPFTPKLFDDLDQEISSVFSRDRLITPDDVRGSHATLNAAVRAGAWPTLAAARGKIVFLMITANGEAGAKGYLEGHPSLKGRLAFLRASPGEDHAAFLMYDNALVRADDIRAYVKQGYLVRTRSDIETYEAKVNDTTRADAAFASGAQVVSTDFEVPGNAYGTPYLVRLPGGGAARCNPVAAKTCR
ncbi:MAG: phosphatidylinositol-specific phospholipase C1-like protein [Caulobacteraceae bacterium]|nr:phosphatidylinositol-specific phospholipase C1-like protein [Caulobacteraceae bacterium]